MQVYSRSVYRIPIRLRLRLTRVRGTRAPRSRNFDFGLSGCIFFNGICVVQKGILGHALGSAHNKNISFARAHLLMSDGDSFKSRRTVSVHRYCRDVVGYSCSKSNYSAHICYIYRLSNTAHDDFIDDAWINIGFSE